MSTTEVAVVALGSNLGDREYHLRRAIRELPIRVVRVSSFLETEPLDAPPPMFLNAVVIGYTSLGPHALLASLLALEKRLGRHRGGLKNEPRIIDLDLIAYGDLRIRTPELTLPHPRAHERQFVMGPLREIAPWNAGVLAGCRAGVASARTWRRDAATTAAGTAAVR